MESVKPSAGDLFTVSAATVRKLEATALTLGAMIDLVRSLTVAPLTVSQRVLVVAAFRSFDRLDPLTEALTGSLAGCGSSRPRSRIQTEDRERP